MYAYNVHQLFICPFNEDDASIPDVTWKQMIPAVIQRSGIRLFLMVFVVRYSKILFKN